MLVKVWWEDLRKAVTADSTQGTSEYQGAGTSLSIFALVSGNFTGFHTHTEWMSPPCPGGKGGKGDSNDWCMNGAWNADLRQHAKGYFVYSILKTKKFWIIKHGRHICLRNSRSAQRYMGSFLDFTFRMLIGWAGKLRSRGRLMIENFRRVGPDNFKMSVEAICPLALYSFLVTDNYPMPCNWQSCSHFCVTIEKSFANSKDVLESIYPCWLVRNELLAVFCPLPGCMHSVTILSKKTFFLHSPKPINKVCELFAKPITSLC